MPVWADGTDVVFHPERTETVADLTGTYVYELLAFYDKDARSDRYAVLG